MLTDQLVLVTGAGGFLASHIVQRLQQDGYRVRGTVRSLTDTANIAAIRNLAPQAKHKIELVVADLCHDEGWDQDTVIDEFHSAIFEGTKRILKAAAKAGIKKFVYTSSLAALIGAPMPYPNEVITEQTWTDLDFPDLLQTEKSRALAEIAVWNFVKEMPEKDKFDLTVLVPTGMMGPPLLKPTILTANLEYMHMMFSRTIPGVPNVQAAISDVRDVAKAYCMTLVTPKACGQRILIHSDCAWLADNAKIVANEFKSQGYSIYTNTLPTFMLWLPSFFDKRLAKSGIVNKIGVPLRIDNKKMKEVFGIKPRPLSDTILDMAYGMIDLDMTVRGKKYRQAGSRAITTPSTS